MPPSSESSPSSTIVGDVPARDETRRRKDAQRDRQVERRSGLADVGRAEVDGDAVRRELEAGVADRAADAVAALPHAGVRQADHPKAGQAERHVHFDLDRTGLDAEHRGGAHAREHASTRCKAVRTARITGSRCKPGGALRDLPLARWADLAGIAIAPATARVGIPGVATSRSGSSTGCATAKPESSAVAGRDVIAVQPFQLLILATVVLNSRAIDESVSPRLTRYISVCGRLTSGR